MRGPPALDAAALAASVMEMVRSQTPKTGFFHELSLQGKSVRDFMAKLEEEKALGTMRSILFVGTLVSPCHPTHFSRAGFTIEDFDVVDYKAMGAARNARLVFCRLRREAEPNFSYADQLGAAEHVFGAAPYLATLIAELHACHRNVELSSFFRRQLESDDCEVLGDLLLSTRARLPAVLGVTQQLRELGSRGLCVEHRLLMARGVAAMVAADVVQLDSYVRPHQVPAPSPAPTPATTNKRSGAPLSDRDARALVVSAKTAGIREAKAQGQLQGERLVSAGLREELEVQGAELEALRAETTAERTRLKRALRDAKTARDGWRAKHQEAVQRETGLEQKLKDLEGALSDAEAK
jgi:hypothetical protein